MTACAASSWRRRGACPGLSTPMPTGDGLLARFLSAGTISLPAFVALCAAARRYGNGVIEVTGRGSIQVRGLTPDTAPRFADRVAELGIAADDGVPVLINPLAGIAAEEILDAARVASNLREVLVRRSFTARLSPKVSVVIDGGGALGLASLSADVRLCAEKTNGDVTLRVAVGGDRKSAVEVGSVATADGTEAVVRLLDIIARRGRACRARDIVATGGIGSFREAFSSCPHLLRVSMSYDRDKDVDGRDIGERSDAVLRTAMPGHDGDPIGIHRLRDGSFACGIGLTFGHSDATALQQLAGAAKAAGAVGFRAAPGHALLAIGLPRAEISDFGAAAEKFGFIVHAGDPRRYVMACAGAPFCSSAHLAARAIAPLVARSVEPHLGPSFQVHVSGCAKGCALAGPAALTIVGSPNGCALIADGSVRDAPVATVAADELLAAIARYAHVAMHEGDHV